MTTTVSSSALGASEQFFLSSLNAPITGQQDSQDQISSFGQGAFKNDRIRRPTRVNKSRIRRHKPLPSRSSWGYGDEDDRRLAADPSVILPSDRRPKKPRLERQEAFREPNTQFYHSDIVDDDAELYKLGLLYDDEHVRGSRFSLDTIVHSDPVYSVRPAKRARKQRQDTSYLHLDLSFASLGSDSDLQHYLVPELALLTPPPEDAPVNEGRRGNDITPARSYRDAVMATIPELPESSIHSLDALIAEKTWFPELIPDIETDIEEDEEDGQDWALLDNADVLSTTDTDALTEDTADATSATGEAWIVLGDGS
ncbi:uncharacterized protein GGS22DRAFT_53515 [Annulohypoxylon maeteangense]|uniref:uncharacterized protein n=1 Tax=Annulohypoxylon maeteangense TaxID=1927788 RepID=UPI002008E10A|nr:uncharacterized protein GGS22DRAFT_53515 [Annulohypoxylon maeteangense]KAI0882009.1 hypothetical protein GGS22DRAFT_53515 [Annulohypoxylon maeteangense]